MFKVLSIDDDRIILKLLDEFLRSEGYTSLTAKNGEEGLTIFKREKPQVVIVDVLMPDIDGLEVLKEVKGMDPEVEVIVMTGFGDMDMVIRALREGASDFLQKPIQIDVLKVALKRAEERRAMRRKLREYAQDLERLVEERTRELQEKNEELEQFVYTVSHDLKAPVVSIEGFSSLLMEMYGDRMDDRFRHYLGRVRDNALYMERLIGDLLEFSRAGRVAKPKEEVNLEEIVRETLEDLKGKAEEAGGTMETVGKFPKVWGDPEHLRKVFFNLLDNALNYSHPERPPEVVIGCEEREEDFLFFVRDNGIGIEPEHIDKVFEMFRRLEDKKGVQGTGMGLTIAKRIVENHGGRIWAESSPGRGSTFFFTLPKGRRDEGAARGG